MRISRNRESRSSTSRASLILAATSYSADIALWSSADDGLNWEFVRTFHAGDDDPCLTDSHPSLATDGQGGWHCLPAVVDESCEPGTYDCKQFEATQHLTHQLCINGVWVVLADCGQITGGAICVAGLGCDNP